MAENNVQDVRIIGNEINSRATSLRSCLSNVIAIKKCGTDKEFRTAKIAFDNAVAEFNRVII